MVGINTAERVSTNFLDQRISEKYGSTCAGSDHWVKSQSVAADGQERGAERTDLHALVCSEQFHAQLVRRKPLATLVADDVVRGPLRREDVLAVHDVHPEPLERAVQRLGRHRVPPPPLPRAQRRARLRCAPREDDLRRERDQLLHEVVRAQMAPQQVVRAPGGIRALDEDRGQGVRDLGRGRAPDGGVLGLDGDAVGLDVAEEDELVLRGVVADEEARAVVLAHVVVPVADGHGPDGDVGEDGVVFAVRVEAAMGDLSWQTRGRENAHAWYTNRKESLFSSYVANLGHTLPEKTVSRSLRVWGDPYIRFLSPPSVPAAMTRLPIWSRWACVRRKDLQNRV